MDRGQQACQVALERQQARGELRGDKPRKFLAVAVWNYDDKCVQVWEITQKSVFDALHEIKRA